MKIKEKMTKISLKTLLGIIRIELLLSVGAIWFGKYVNNLELETKEYKIEKIRDNSYYTDSMRFY